MTTPVLIAVFVALAIVMAALGGWHHHNKKENRATTHNQEPLPMYKILNWLVRRVARIEDKLNRLHGKVDDDMSTKEEILAKVTAMHGVVQSVAVAVDELNGEMTSISEEIARLQKLIEDGQTVDLTELDAKVDEVSAAIAALLPAIKANPNP